MMKPSDIESVEKADPVAVKRATDNAEKDLRNVGVHEVPIATITLSVAVALATEAKNAGWRVHTKPTEKGPVLVIEHSSFSSDQSTPSESTKTSSRASAAIKSSKSRGTSTSSGRNKKNAFDLVRGALGSGKTKS
jgi:hypothetical protein